MVTTISTRIHAANSGPTISEMRGDGAMRNRSKKPLSMSRTVQNPRPTPAKPEPMQHASGRYQLTERSVGKPGILVMAKNVPLNAIVWNTGMANAGKKADGSRRMLRRPRSASPRTSAAPRPVGTQLAAGAGPAGDVIVVIGRPIVSTGCAAPGQWIPRRSDGNRGSPPPRCRR